MSDIQAPNAVSGNDRVRGKHGENAGGFDPDDMKEPTLKSPKRQNAGKVSPHNKSMPLHKHNGLTHWHTANHPA